MGNNSAKIDSNISKADSESSSNCGKEDKLETMDCLEVNKDAIINRVWIAKKAISSTDRHVKKSEPKLEFDGYNYNYNYHFNPATGMTEMNLSLTPKYKLESKKIPIELIKPIINIFKIKNSYHSSFKHWGIIIELSNGSFVNIQFGRTGFSLKEFNNTKCDGENILNSILGLWGEDNAPPSFCYLGNANYKYYELKNILYEIKNKEIQSFNKEKKVYYNLATRNCQHFACDIEKILFGQIQMLHSFDYYIDEFYNDFFPNININKLQLKYDNDVKMKNEELFKLNIKTIEEYKNKNSDSPLLQEQKKRIESWYSLKYDDFLNSL